MNRGAIAVLCGAVVGAALFRRYPFPDHEPLPRMVHGQAAWLFYTLRYSWQLMMSTTPALLFSVLASVASSSHGRGSGVLARCRRFPNPPTWAWCWEKCTIPGACNGRSIRTGW
jgi:hypothetical protein